MAGAQETGSRQLLLEIALVILMSVFAEAHQGSATQDPPVAGSPALAR
jgi:hypothetical protein